MWSWASGTLVESIFQERPPPPRPSYGGTLRLTFSPSLSVLLRRAAPLGNWGKAPSPLQLYSRQSEGTRTPDGGLYHTTNATWAEPDFSALRLFSFFLSLNANSLFQDLTHLRGGPKTASGRKVCLQATKGVLAGALPGVTQRLKTQLPDPPWGSKGG
jgi:hypothetical protein